MTPKNLSLLMLATFTVFFISAIHYPVFAANKEKKGFRIAAVNSIIDDAPATPVNGNGNGLNDKKERNALPEKGFHNTHHKMTLQKIEELGKQHRFHRKRINKLKNHPGKVWAMLLLVVVSCHIALLLHAFLHIGH